MKIITWNCNGAFRKKSDFLQDIDWDVAVIQECENPAECKGFVKNEGLCDFLGNYKWIGDNKNKGLAVFARNNNIKIDERYSNISSEFCKYGDSEHKLKYFLPVQINGHTIIACWCHTGDERHFRYIGQCWKYLLLNSNLIDSKTLFIGDFNANKIWDYETGWWGFSAVNEMLNKKGLYSFYHYSTKEEFGKELTPTFYLQRNRQKCYHIDYAYGNPKTLRGIEILEIPNIDEKALLSDHFPIYVEVIWPFL